MQLLLICQLLCFIVVGNTLCTHQSSLNSSSYVTCYTGSEYVHGPITCNCTNTAVNCSYRDLTHVPASEFDSAITFLDLHNNRILALPNCTFIRYAQLVELDLSYNVILSLGSLAFYGLVKLKMLNLRTNNLQMYDGMFPIDVFVPLVKLDTLLLNNNNYNVSDPLLNYPDRALSVLSNLTYLYLDGLRKKTLGPGFQNLTSLKSISFSGNVGVCFITKLRNVTFQFIKQIENLDLSNCSLSGRHFHKGAFSGLTNLKSLNISNNENIGWKSLLKIFDDIKEIDLKELHIGHIVGKYSMGICLSKSNVRNFPKHLEFLSAEDNNILAFGNGVLEELSPNLAKLDLSGNWFILGEYLNNITKLTNVRHLILSGSRFIYNLPLNYPNRSRAPSNSTFRCEALEQDVSFEENEFAFPLPPNLLTLEMDYADLSYKLTKFVVGKNSLQNLSLAKNTFPSLIGPIIGLDKLQSLDFSFNYIEFIADDFFNTLSTIVQLNLSNNLLGSFLGNLESSKVFAALTNLKILDLSSNFIIDFKIDLFCNLTKLEYFYIKGNALIKFEVDISRMPQLRFLNFHTTRMSTLNSTFRESIDALLANNVNVTINMKDTPIKCDCDNYDFMQWMTSSGAFNRSFEHYLCIYPDGKGMCIEDGYEKDMRKLDRKCLSNVGLFTVIACALLLTVCTVVGFIMYRYRWKLRYLYNAAYLQVKGSARGEEDSFEYDAFISYDQEDHDFVVGTLVPELEKRGLSLCLHASDFIAGEYISSNIVKAVCSSRRTVVVLTKNMLSSYWCNFEIQMANMEALQTGRRVLIFLLTEHMPTRDLGVELLYYIRSNTYIPFPENFRDSTGMSWLWDKVAKDIA